MKLTKPIDLAAVKAVRDLLWGEVAFHENQGESLTLPEELWAAAAAAQAEREQDDPIFEVLGDAIDLLPNNCGVIVPVEDLWKVLGYEKGNSNRAREDIRKRMAQAMQRFGFGPKTRRRLRGDADREYVYLRPPGPKGIPDFAVYRWRESERDGRGGWKGSQYTASPADAPLILDCSGRRGPQRSQ